MTKAEIEFQDYFFQFGEVTSVNMDFFRIKYKTSRPYEYDNTIHFMIRYEMNLNVDKIDRTIYGTLDWLGDIGGFNEALSWLTQLIMYFFAFDQMNIFLV